MADPFSCAANVVAILGVGARSCQFLFDLINKFADAPEHVQQRIVWLRALHSTFCELQNLAGEALLRDDLWSLPDGFPSRLQDAVTDLRCIERRLSRVEERLKKRGIAHAWARAKFAFDGDRWLKAFFERLQMYQATFTLDLMNLQM